MPHRSSSIATYLDRTSVLDRLGLLRASATVPSLHRCPLCAENAMEVHWDEVNAADWVWCAACEFAGDLIELTAAMDGDGVAAACSHLAQLCVLPPIADEVIDRYLRDHVQRRQEFETFWNQATERVRRGEPADVLSSLQTLGFSRRDFLNHGDKIADWIGFASKQELEDLWHPGSYRPKHRVDRVERDRIVRGAGPGASRLFRGRGWQDVVVIRCTDLPGRTCGLIFMGRQGRREEGDVFFRPVPGSRRCNGVQESGLVMREQLRVRPATKRGPKWPGTRFVCTDPLHAISLQMDAIRDGFSSTLPVIAVWTEDGCRPRNCWSGISPRTLVFWDPEDDEVALREASRIGASVGNALPEGQPVYRTESIVNHVYKTRKQSLEAIRDELSDMTVLEAGSFLRRLHLSASQAKELGEDLTPELRALIQQDGIDRVFSVGSMSIRETKGGWHDVRTGRQLASGIVRLTEISGSGSETERVRGKVTLDGRDWWFEFPIPQIESRGLFRVLQEHLRQQGCDDFSFLPTWAKHAWDAALAVSSPRAAEVLRRVGWEPELQRFCLPGCDVSQTSCQYQPRRSFDSPLSNWLPTGPRSDDAFSQWSLPEQTTFWSLVIVIVERLLRSSLGLPPRGLLVCGVTAQEYVCGLGHLAGLLTPEYPSRSSAEDQVEWLNREVNRHDVPPILDLRGGRGQAGVGKWLEGLGSRAAVILAPELTSLSALAQRRFHRLELPKAWRARRDWTAPDRSPAGLALEWLVDVYRRRTVEKDRERSLLEMLIGDLDRWLATGGIESKCSHHIVRALTPAENIEPVNQLSELGQHPLVLNALGSVSADSFSLELPRTVLDEELRRHNAPEIDWTFFANSRDQGIFPAHT